MSRAIQPPKTYLEPNLNSNFLQRMSEEMTLREFISDLGDIRAPRWVWVVVLIVFVGGPFITFHLYF